MTCGGTPFDGHNSFNLNHSASSNKENLNCDDYYRLGSSQGPGLQTLPKAFSSLGNPEQLFLTIIFNGQTLKFSFVVQKTSKH